MLIDTPRSPKRGHGVFCVFLKCFILGTSLYVMAALPLFITRGLPFFYYGDYNVQQIPFYMAAHRAVREGGVTWLWNVDLGGPLCGTFAFYLLGSPFFWLTVPFPESAIPYLMPFLMALKYGTCTATAYFYIRRYTVKDSSALSGALLFAFSGFNACNIVFNHFTDAVAFFPLLLLTFDRLMETEHHRDMWDFWLSGRRFTAFIFTVSLCAVINYYFFFGEAVFLAIYFCVRYIKGNRKHAILRMLIRGGCGVLLGLMIPAFYLLQAAGGVSGNARLSDILAGYDLVAYDSMKLPWDIIKSMLMVPDIIGRGTLFYTSPVKNASLAVYLPMFGVSGVAAWFFMKNRKKDPWLKRLLVICLVISMIPGLNALFSLMNETYYARWFYMPILFMSIATVMAFERGRKTELKKGAVVSAVGFLLIVAVALLPGTDDDGKLRFPGDTLENPHLFWRNVIVTGALYLILFIIVFFIPRCVRYITLPPRRNAAGFVIRKKIFFSHPFTRQKVMLPAVCISCVLATGTVLVNGSSLISDYGKKMWEEQMLESAPAVGHRTWFRTETDSTSTNYDMVWGFSSVHGFISTVPGETFDFLEGSGGIVRTVETNIPLDRRGMRAILSAKYYFENSDINKDGAFLSGKGTDGYRLSGSGHGIDVYTNTNFIPMGFCFDSYIREEDYEKLDAAEHDDLLVRAIILDDEAVKKYGHLMKELPASQYDRSISSGEFSDICDRLAETSCTEFVTNGRGFEAETADLKKESLVFFSIPAVKGFKLKVDGKKAEVVKADHGFMAVCVPEGVHSITGEYVPPARGLGVFISIIGVVLLFMYHMAFRRKLW